MYQWALRNQKGFTLVELLIVIVVIAILAAISVVAYNGVQTRATDNGNLSNANVISKAINLYYVDNGKYPICASGDGMSCTLASVAASLSPTYIAIVPDDPNPAVYRYWYVGTASNSGMWSVRMYKRSIGGYCKFGSPNMLTTWWSSAPNC